MNEWAMFLEHRISMIFMLLFLLLYLPWHYSRRVTVVLAILCFLLTGIADYMNISVLGDTMRIQITLSESIVILLSAYLISAYRDYRALFTGITASVYILFGNVFFSVIFQTMENACLALAGQAFLHGLILSLLNWKIRPWYLKIMEKNELYWKRFWLIPTFYYVIVYSMVAWPGNLKERPENYVTVMLVLFQMVFSYGILFQMFGRSREDYELRRSNQFLETYARRLSSEADVLQKKENETAMFRHDLRHYVNMIEAYMEQGDQKKIHELLKQMNLKLEDTVYRRYCENLAVNGVLRYGNQMADQKEVSFSTDVEIPQQINVNEVELAAVISNLLENAVHAAAQVSDIKERFTKISVHCIRGQMILEVLNSFEGNRKISDKTGLPVSEEGEGHGYGMLSVQAFARKNDAVFHYSIEKNIFQVRILIGKALQTEMT